MTINPSFPIEAYATLTLANQADSSFSTLRQAMAQQAREHELQIREDTDTALCVEVASFGQLRITAQENGFSVYISAALPDRLFMLKDGFSENLEQLLPEAAKALRWSDSATQASLPPNLHFTTVQSITPIGTAFLRVRINGEDLSSFQDDAIHFRLVLPPAGCGEPVWPSLSENGTTVWPKGENALHRPVYTTRWIDRQAGLMDFDIFLHDGGRATEWVRSASVGEVLAIAGPGGGGIPQVSHILLFADETAFPAAARILASLPADSQGQATLVAAEGEACGYPISAPKGVQLTWRVRRDASDLAERALSARAAQPAHCFWFASEKSDVTPVRQAIKASPPAAGTSYIAAYWSKP
ncbi:siderophore-interacting protein [Pseudophaeobacter leonis]|uniref:siderophore-interacting protein n=1 Tax=Pseudophaeobacter leonis TaxID=1144477 RepID=UPI0009F39435|nr:siderophore-interacting protein [Pseudophaeobacter leonis]